MGRSVHKQYYLHIGSLIYRAKKTIIFRDYGKIFKKVFSPPILFIS